MKKRFKALALMLAFLMALSLSLTACGSQGSGSGENPESAAEYIIRLGHSDTEDNLINISLQNYAKWVNEQTGGRVIIRIPRRAGSDRSHTRRAPP